MALELFKGSSFKHAPDPPDPNNKSFSGVQGAVFQKNPLAAGGINDPDRGEKNYFFIHNREHPRIDLPRRGSSRGQNYYGKLFLSIAALQDIFIGSGEIEKNGSHLVDVFTYVLTGSGDRTWNIPGSSLKGCIYTHLAMFLQSRSIDFFSAREGKAKVFFSDLPMAPGTDAAIKEITARFSPRAVPEDAVVKLYKKEYQKDTRLRGSHQTEPGQERLRVIRVGSRFAGHLHFKQLDEYEITLLVLALGSMPGNSFNFKIGGAKNRAMGLVRLQIDFEKSYYSKTLKDTAVGNVHPFAELKPNLEKTLVQLKQEYPALDLLLKKIQGEYGQ